MTGVVAGVVAEAQVLGDGDCGGRAGRSNHARLGLVVATGWLLSPYALTHGGGGCNFGGALVEALRCGVTSEDGVARWVVRRADGRV